MLSKTVPLNPVSDSTLTKRRQQTTCERCLDFDDTALAQDLFGPQNENIRLVSEKTGARIDTRGCTVFVHGDDIAQCDRAADVLVELYGLLKKGLPVYPQDVRLALSSLEKKPGVDLSKVFTDAMFVVSPKKTIIPKTLSQRSYLGAIVENDLVFGIGPAGTGKTYLAVAMAVRAIMEKRVKRIILTRPAVEAGEKLGFLPGDLTEKVDPYLRPLYDALNDMLDPAKVRDMITDGVIEIAPLAFMRGRTLTDAFVILDEAQNTTPEQMKMFLTRIGYGSRAVVTGDVTQIDLPPKVKSGLVQAISILKEVKGISFVFFDETDVIRHPLVARIVNAYERYAKKD